MADKKSSKAGRKINSIQGKMYKTGMRWDINKKKRIARHKKRMAEQASKVLRVARGTARAARRAAVDWNKENDAREARREQAKAEREARLRAIIKSPELLRQLGIV